jgi:hypothetical protein
MEIDPETLALLRDRPGTWAAYQNVALDSSSLGHLQFLKVGPGCTYETAPAHLPDTAHCIGWPYRHVGFVDLKRGEIVPDAVP